jgi:hypothetical protein
MPDIKQFLSRRYLRLVDNLSESFLLSQSITTDWKTQRLIELMEQINTCIIYREVLLDGKGLSQRGDVYPLSFVWQNVRR